VPLHEKKSLTYYLCCDGDDVWFRRTSTYQFRHNLIVCSRRLEDISRIMLYQLLSSALQTVLADPPRPMSPCEKEHRHCSALCVMITKKRVMMLHRVLHWNLVALYSMRRFFTDSAFVLSFFLRRIRRKMCVLRFYWILFFSSLRVLRGSILWLLGGKCHIGLLQISYAFQQWKNFENRLRSDKITETLKVGILRHSIVLFVRLRMTSC